MAGDKKESVREMLLRISGEVDPSVHAAFKEYQDTIEESAKMMGLSKENLDGLMVKFAEARKALEGFSEVWKKYTEETKKAGEETDDTKKKQEEQKKETKKSNSVLRAFANLLGVTTGALARFGLGLGLAYAGLKQMQRAASTIKSRLTGMFQGGINAAGTFANVVVEGFKDISKAAIEINSTFQQTEITLRAMTQSESGAATLMKILREEAMRTGTSFRELSSAAPRLIPFSGGDVEQFKQLIGLAARVKSLRPELQIATAVRTMGQFLSGYEQTLYRTFGIPTEFIKKYTDVLGNTPEALNTILNEWRATDELVQAQSQSWEGLMTTIKDFGERTLRGITGPAFDYISGKVQKFTNWLVENSDQLRALAHNLGRDIGVSMGSVTDQIMGPDGFSEDTLFEVADWGAKLIASLVRGILWGVNNVLIPTIVQITTIMANYLKGSSPPKMGILSTIDQWFGPIIRAYLGGFNAQDFSNLVEVGRIIKASLKTAVAGGDISQEEMNKRLLATRALTVQLVQELRTLGAVSAETWGKLGSQIGMDVQLIQGFIELTQKLEAAQRALAAAEAAYAAAMAKVRKAQEEIRLFEMRTAEIPERYKRGRRMELEFRLMAAQKEARLRQEAVKIARQQVQVAQQMLNAYKQMIQALEQLADDALKVKKDMEDAESDVFGFGAMEGTGDAVERLTGKFKDLYDSIRESFKEAREEMQYLLDFIKGMLGRPAFSAADKKDAGARGKALNLPEGYKQGVAFAETVAIVAENFYKVRDAMGKVAEKVREVIDLWDKAPDWLKTVFKKGALVLAINWATGGMLAGLTKLLLGAGLSLSGGIWGLTILAGIKLAEFVVGDITGADKSLIQDFLKKRVPELWFSIGAYIDAEGIVKGLRSLFTDLGREMTNIYDTLPWYVKALLWLTPLGPGLEFGDELAGSADKVADLLNFMTTPPAQPETLSLWEKFKTDILSVFSGSAGETAEAAQIGIVDPIVAAAEEVEDITVGHSIFPDMIETIVNLFTDLPGQLMLPLSRMVMVIQRYGGAAAKWFTYSTTIMRRNVQALVRDLYLAIRVLNDYYSALARSSAVSTTPDTGGHDSGAGYATGGFVTKLEKALVHPGELILNVAQQRNVAAAIAGGGVTPSAGFGAGAMNVSFDQRDWKVTGTPDVETVKKLAREGAYEGICEVFNEAQRRGGEGGSR